MRFLLFLLTLAGLAAAVGYPWALANFSGEEIGSIPLFGRATGYAPATVVISDKESPVHAFVDFKALGHANAPNGITAMTLTVSADGTPVRSAELQFRDSSNLKESDPGAGMTIRADAGLLTAEKAQSFTFNLAPGPQTDIPAERIDLVLRANAQEPDPRVQPAGFVAAALGFIGLVLALRPRGGGDGGRGAPPRKWGRG